MPLLHVRIGGRWVKLETEFLGETRFLFEGIFSMRKVRIVSGGYYHLHNRGVDRGPIFFEQRNWGFFIKQLRKYFDPELADIVAYCLMPNHYHLLILSKSDRIGLEVMQPLAVSYTKAINTQQNRVGPLFQRPYQVRQVISENHLAWLSRYIHMNPVEAGLVTNPVDWQYSSYRDYIEIRCGTLPVTANVLSQFDSRSDYRKYVEQDDGTAQSEISDTLMD
jgi:putative transposase